MNENKRLSDNERDVLILGGTNVTPMDFDLYITNMIFLFMKYRDHINAYRNT